MKHIRSYTALLLLCLLLIPSLASCGGSSQKAVGTCGDFEILYEELYFEAMTYLGTHPQCTEEELWEAVEQSICQRYAIPLLYGEYLTPTSLDDEMLIQKAEADVESMITSLGGKSEYKEHLSSIHATEHFFTHFLKLSLLQLELEEAVFADTELESVDTLVEWWKNGNCSRVTELQFADETTAKAARLKLVGGATPEELSALSEFSSMTLKQSDYYFRGLKNTEKEHAAVELKTVGAISDPIATDKGFSILLREENDYELLKTYQAATALDLYREQRISSLIEEKASTLTVSWNDYAAALSIKELK